MHSSWQLYLSMQNIAISENSQPVCWRKMNKLIYIKPMLEVQGRSCIYLRVNMPSCVAFDCTNRAGKKAGITFHRFPKKESLKAEWIKACRRKDWFPSKSSVLCSNHFSEDQIDRTSLLCTRLHENAIPNVFSAFPPYLQNALKKRKLPTKLTELGWKKGRSALKHNSVHSSVNNQVEEIDDQTLPSKSDQPCTSIQDNPSTNVFPTSSGSIEKPSQDSDHPDYTPNEFKKDHGRKERKKRHLRIKNKPAETMDINSGDSFSSSHSNSFSKYKNVSLKCISCSIPGCKTKSPRKIEHSSGVEENIPLFPVPQTSDHFIKWKEALKGTNIKLTKDALICERHFLENDIERFHKTKTPDGEIVESQKRPTLKSGAVPVNYLTLPFHTAKDSPNELSVSQNPDIINSKRSITETSSSAFNSDDSGNNAFSIKNQIPDDSSVQNPVDSSVNFIQEIPQKKKHHMSYKHLVRNVQDIIKPSTSWSVVCTHQFTIFARWNNKFVAEKRLVIERSLTVRVFLDELEIEMTGLVDLTSVDDVSLLLEKVENLKLI